MYRSRSVTPSGPTARSRLRRSMRTPAWARRTLAGARSPERASSLPAMLSCVTSTARPPSSSARATAIGPPIGSNSTTSPSVRQRRRRRAGRRRRRGRRPRRARRTRGHRRAPPVHCTTHPPAGTSVVPVRTSTPSRATSAASQATSEPFGPATAASPPSRRRPLDERDAMAARRRDPRRLQPGRAAADDGDVRRARRAGDVPVRVLGLAARRRLADARHERVAGVAHLARLVAAGARPDLLGVPARSLATRSGSAIWARVISTAAHCAGSS